MPTRKRKETPSSETVPVQRGALKPALRRISLYLALWKLLDFRRPGHEWLEVAPPREKDLWRIIDEFPIPDVAPEYRDVALRDIETTLRIERENDPEKIAMHAAYLRDTALEAAGDIQQLVSIRNKRWHVSGLVYASSALAEIVGSDALPRAEVITRVWDYVKTHGLQDQHNRRIINTDAKLSKVVGGRTRISMFELTAHLQRHLK